MRKLRLPSPAMVVACLALFVAMSGTALAATPVVKRALFANNAGKLQGKTAADVAALPGPASTAMGLLTMKTQAGSIAADGEQEYSIGCDAGKKIVSGGFSSNGAVMAFDSRPTNDATWAIYLVNLNRTQGANVSVYALCMG